MTFTCKKIASLKTSAAGQVCITSDYALVHISVLDAFIDGMKEALTGMYGENPKESKDYSRIINEFHTERLERII